MRYYNIAAARPALASYLAGFIIMSVIYLHGFGTEKLTPAAIRDMIITLEHWGPLLYIVCNALRPFFLFPAMVLGIAGGLAFGPVWGTVYLVTGTTLGAALCFSLARLVNPERTRRFFAKWLVIEKLENQAAQNGFRTMLLLRLAPILPWDAVSFMAGLFKIRFGTYILATFLGSIPGAVAFSCLGDALFQPAESVSLAMVGGIAVWLVYVYGRGIGTKIS